MNSLLPPQQSRRPLPLALSISALLALSSLSAQAGALTVNNGSLSVTPSGATASLPLVAFSVVPFSYDGGTAVKLAGDQTFTATTTNPTITISFNGTASATASDKFSIGYNFSDILTASAGTVTPSVSVNALLLGFIPVSAGGALPPGGPGTTPYSGSFQSDPSPLTTSANYTASATFNWTGAAPGDTLRISVPNNSIDFAVSPNPLPEPGTIGLLLLAAPMLGLYRRRD